ncbi:general substrate transporter [Amylocarpus encephaloides]|uniref:General substrate transporter n=1 Tax=Amylocarpus encephaloides TaxID=45428 RepID=A0A9P8C8A0_9HELO|nr:general substrate transporter [Amylocarpus encephaloides]
MGIDRQIVGADLATVLPQDNARWWTKSHLVKLNLMLFSAILFSGTVGYDNSMMNGLQALPQWKEFMHEPKGAYLGLVNATQALGAIFGYPCMAVLANKYGRKRPIYVGCFVLAFGTALQTTAQNREMFIASRAFIGLASGFFGSVPILITEAAYPTHRGKMTASYNTFYYVGSLLAAWATFGTRNYDNSWAWRVPSLLQVAFPGVCIWGVLLCPESPRWLIAAGRVEDARSVLIKYHAGGDEHSPLVTFEMAEIEQAIQMGRHNTKSTSYADMFKTNGNRHRLFISVSIGVFGQWNGVGVVSYYLAAVLQTVGITSVTQQTLISGFLQLFNLTVAVWAATLVDRVGRRVLWMTSGLGMLVSYIIITGLSGSFDTTKLKGTGLAVIPMLFIFYGFYDIAFTPLLVSYPAEIWQYELRSRGVAVVQSSTFAALFFNLFVNPIALDSIGWKYYIVYIVILIVLCVTIWFAYPETRGMSLEEIAKVFDGDDAALQQGVILSAVEENMAANGVGKDVEHMDEKQCNN